MFIFANIIRIVRMRIRRKEDTFAILFEKTGKKQNSNIYEYSINIRIFAFANIIRIVRNRICLDSRNVHRTFRKSTIQEFEYLRIFKYSINIRIFAFANIIRIVQNRICLDSRNVHRTFRESTIQHSRLRLNKVDATKKYSTRHDYSVGHVTICPLENPPGTIISWARLFESAK